MSEAINPVHYKRLPAEAIQIIESAIDNAPSAQDAYLHGQVLKYVLRCWNKNGIEDLCKAKWYLDRLIEHCDESLLDANKNEKPKNASDFVKFRKPFCVKEADIRPIAHSECNVTFDWIEPSVEVKKTTNQFKVGDWVKIKKPSDTQSSACIWVGSMNKYDGQVIQVKEIEEGAVVHEDYGFLFSWLEPTEPPKEQPQLPHGWRWLEEDEVIRKGDGYRHGGKWWDYDNSIGAKVLETGWLSIRRNRFEVGEKVVECVNNRIGVVKDIEAIGSGKNFLCHVEMQDTKGVIVFSPNQLAPYIEQTT